MGKRFTDTSKFKKPFLRSLPKSYKLLWAFICDDCDNAGIWIVDMKAAKLYLGVSCKEEEALRLFNSDEQRVVPLDKGRKWFLPSFIEFQYGILKPSCNPHLPVIAALQKFGLLDDDLKLVIEKEGYIYPKVRVPSTFMDKDKDKDKEEDKEKEGGVGGLEQDLTDALDQTTLDAYFMQFNHKGVNVEQEATAFRAKVTTTPNHYRNHRCEGLRHAFFKHLQNVRPKNGGFSAEERQRQINAKIDAA